VIVHRRCTAALLLAAALSFMLILAAGCSGPDEPILVGFAGPLQGKYSDLGVQGRNGAQLALEHVNARGGVAGRRLELLALDDGNDPERAAAVAREFAAMGVAAVIGHMTSATSMAAVPVAEEAGMVLVSPTTSTPYLSDRRDHFFRVIGESTEWARGLARFALVERGVTDMALVTDMDNAAYAVPYAEAFAERFRSLGGTVSIHRRVHASGFTAWRELACELTSAGAGGVMATLSARDLANMAQALRRECLDTPLYSSMWAYTRELLVAGGKAVEGVVFGISYTADNTRPEFLTFKQAYRERFGWEPNFAAALSYEAAMLLARGLRETGGTAEGLAAALAGQPDLPGVIGPFSMDAYGDVQRPGFIVTIRDHEFTTIDTLQ
jgi:branched-chain amino acid transport system substrate-binding protein